MLDFLKRKKLKSYSPIIINIEDDEYLKEFIYEWNLKNPIDRWYRDKYKIAFNSPIHRVISFVDMKLEWEEYKVFSEMKFKYYKKNIGDWLDTSDESSNSLSQEEMLDSYKKEFENIDLSQYND